LKTKLVFLALMGACAPRVEVGLTSIADQINPVLSRVEFTIDAGERRGATETEIITLPHKETLVLPDGFDLLSLHVTARAFIGEQEVALGVVDILPGQKEAAISFSICSNGAPEALEVCDDGNLTSGDGCDATCKPTGCASGVATSGELCFLENDNLIGPPDPKQVLAADFDGDGLPDLVAPYALGGVVRIFTNTGSFGDFTEFSVPGAERLALGDLDGDGDTDVLTSVHRSNAAPGYVVLTNEGGIFGAGPEISLSAFSLSALEISAIALEDLDSDGKLDLLFTDKNTGLLKVNLAKEGADLGSQSQAISVGFDPIALSLADLDDDGDLDVVTANASSSASVLLNTGGELSAVFPLPIGGVPSAIAFGEFDTKPGIDLAITKQENGVGKVRLFKGLGSGVFQVVADFDLGTQPSALIAADLDLDGDIDLAATDQNAAKIVVLFNNGQGQFDAPRDASGGLFDTRLGPVSLAVSDFNADGVPDLVAAGANLGVLLSNP
jgi:cysteine-rich repeat protein